MEKSTRRQFTQQTLGSLLTYSLLETIFSGDGKLDMVFKGGTTARSEFAWDVELKNQPVVE